MSDFSAKALLASAKAAAEQPSSDIRTELGGLARAEGYEIDYAAYGHIVGCVCRAGIVGGNRLRRLGHKGTRF